MSNEQDNLIPVFMPALSAMLIQAEDKKGSPLSKQEVLRIRDKSPCIMMEIADARKLAESRGYRDIDPENCWHDWQMTRRELGRKPDLDPGPRFDQVRSSDPEYQQTIRAAHETIDQFRRMLPADGSPRSNALIKTKLTDGESSAFMWLMNTSAVNESFTAELFEVPDSLPSYEIGQRFDVSIDSLLDWMVNEDGVLHGGYSLRYHRERLSHEEQIDFDQHIGVTRYA